ncbi:hypothetical protein AALP_AA5G223000 [Arabis alpina]|uniref:F-box domain-containing protein n=1 Tax=Arabis alpina TaxID=50452 RepID=A0A087GYR3_ARAAL|nr:hypothetical protein AALP_AA5G223000 [Arabis alpina]
MNLDFGFIGTTDRRSLNFALETDSSFRGFAPSSKLSTYCRVSMENIVQQFLEVLETQVERDIPIDLLIDIFSRVPAKTIATSRCISKLWGSILCRTDFTELFLAMSSTRPRRLLFTFEAEDNIFFFSSPQPRNPDDNSSLLLTRYQVHRKQSPTDFIYKMNSPNHGFICRQDRRVDRGKMLDTIVICNPVTGESISLPKGKPKIINMETRPYFGYDSVDKQFKVLCIYFEKIPNTPNTCYEHQVSTLEDGVCLWRTIQCKPHYPESSGLCIDGVLYYTARHMRVSMIVCFDVRFEKFNFIDIDECMLMTSHCTLINYKGKLGAFTLLFGRLELWVLEDAGWSKNFYTLPPLWNNVVGRTQLNIVGVTDRNEVVLSLPCLMDPFYVYYYNLVSKSFTRVQIQGFGVFKYKKVYTFLDYDENLKHM